MGVEPIVGTVGTLSQLCCSNATLNHRLCELDGLSGRLLLLYRTPERSHVRGLMNFQKPSSVGLHYRVYCDCPFNLRDEHC